MRFASAPITASGPPATSESCAERAASEGGAEDSHDHGGDGGTLTVGAGVEVFTDFAEHGQVRRMPTPSGDVAATTHYGEYSDMGAAYAALEQWCTGNGRRPAGVNWEVYGDGDDDPARLRTDVYFLLEPTARLVH